PMISMSKRQDLLNNAKEFLNDLSGFFEEFGVRVLCIRDVPDPYRRKNGTISRRVRLALASDPDNLLCLYSKIGFSFHPRKQSLANAVIQYLKEKKLESWTRRQFAIDAAALREETGWGPRRIHSHLAGRAVAIPVRFVERTLYEGRKTAPR